MRKVMLACVMAASLAACSWHHERDRDVGSGSSTPPVAQTQGEPRGMTGTSRGAATDWSKCDQHPYTPGPRDCK
jgi:hypothetical protein